MRFVKFALVGLSNTAITFAVFNVLVRWLGLPLLAGLFVLLLVLRLAGGAWRRFRRRGGAVAKV